jgi:hypothetical protein
MRVLREVEPKAVRSDFERLEPDGAELSVEERYPAGTDPSKAAEFYQRLDLTDVEVTEADAGPVVRASTAWMDRSQAIQIAGLISSGLVTNAVAQNDLDGTALDRIMRVLREVEPKAVRFDFERLEPDGAELSVEERYPAGTDPSKAAEFYQRLDLTDVEVTEADAGPVVRASTAWMDRSQAIQIASLISSGLWTNAVAQNDLDGFLLDLDIDWDLVDEEP